MIRAVYCELPKNVAEAELVKNLRIHHRTSIVAATGKTAKTRSYNVFMLFLFQIYALNLYPVNMISAALESIRLQYIGLIGA